MAKKMKSFRFDDYMLEELSKRAQHYNISESEFLRNCFWQVIDILDGVSQGNDIDDLRKWIDQTMYRS